MKLLSIDSSGKTAACAVTEDGQILTQSFTDSGLTHSQTLLPIVDDALKLASVSIDEIDAFAVTVGPGSFTGLRIGASLVMGLAGKRPVYPVPTLLALAYNFCDRDCIIIPALDARRNQVYTAVFEAKGGVVSRLEEDSAMAVTEVLERIENYRGKEIIIAGDGAYLFGAAEGVIFPEGKMLYTQGVSIARAAKDVNPVDAQDIKLSYLRPSQAERELKERMKND